MPDSEPVAPEDQSPDDQSEVLAFLGELNGQGEGVERIDTHGASVFLSGNRAFKLKRAVRYPYLDFSTRAKRRTMCWRELELNQRTAPELYLAVRPVRRSFDGSLQLGAPVATSLNTPDDDDALDWVIEMRRFAADGLFDTMAREGRLSAVHLRDVADAIARFHETACAVPTQGDHDATERVRAVIVGNRTSMSATGEDILPPELCDALLTKSLAALERSADVLDTRARRGLVRLGHGDLHLSNICLWEGRATLFDCLEFDDELASGDVLYDLAFLVMDLWHRGERDGAALVFNRYLDMTATEGDAFAVMPLFLSMRAAVRAHVNASAALRMERGARREARCAEARGYLARALEFLDPVPVYAIAVGGLSGTGKSTVSARLAAHLGPAPGARWLRTDVFRKRMAGQTPETVLPPSAYTHDTSRKVYGAVLDAGKAVLRNGGAVLFDGVFADPDERQSVADLADALETRFLGFWLKTDRAVLAARISQRQGDASDATVAVLDAQLARPVGDLGSWHVIDSGGDTTAVRDAILGFLDKGQRSGEPVANAD